jgi:hypothetical protein
MDVDDIKSHYAQASDSSVAELGDEFVPELSREPVRVSNSTADTLG